MGRKATGPKGIAGLPKDDQKEPDCRSFIQIGDPVFIFKYGSTDAEKELDKKFKEAFINENGNGRHLKE